MDRCSTCDHSIRCVLGNGPSSDTLFLGEKPGQEEDRRGIPFCGQTGQELNNLYLPIAGLDRVDVRVTNAVKCRLGNNNDKPTDEQIETCASHWLPAEIEACSPQVIFLMGATACSLVPRVELDKDHGLPLQVTAEDCPYFGGWSGWVFPSYHPASALHDTSMMIPLLEDFERFRLWTRNRWQMPTPAPRIGYSIVESKVEIQRSLDGCIYDYIPLDTENDGKQPWSLQYSTKPGNGFLIRADRPDLIQYFDKQTRSYGFTMHYAEHDLDVLEALKVKKELFKDTMRMAYALGNLPQGLKALGWRKLGVRMRDYEDVVKPHSRKVMITWLNAAWDLASDNRVRVETQLKTKLKVTYKPSELERGLKRIMSHSHKPKYDVWDKTVELTDKLNVTALNEPIPHPSIKYVPLNEAVEYACQDADVTGQVATTLEALSEEIVTTEWCVPEEDWDK